MKKFEVGKWYEWRDRGYDPIKVMSRTDKSIVVNNGTNQWRMFVKIDDEGCEYVVDSKVPSRWRWENTCSCKQKVKHYRELDWRELAIGDEILLVAYEFDGRSEINAAVAEIHKDHAIARSEDGITLWLDDMIDGDTLTLYKVTS